MKTLKQLNTYSTTTVTFTDEAAGIGQTLPNRYQINGLLDTKNTVLSNIDRLCSAAGSWLSYDTHEGKWGVVINQTGTSVASFDDSNIIGSIGINGTGLYDLYNSTNVQFPHRDLRDNPDFVKIEIPSGDRNANEFNNKLDISYDVLNEPVQAQLLGFMELKQSRIDLVINFKTDYSYINLKAGDLISVTNSRLSFTNKVFRIITITEVQEDAGPLLMEISALEYNASIYSTTDLYRYTRTDENGIVTIGSIGTPGTPQVTKFEVDARPGILVESLAPTGVVESMEFWISNDVTLTEANRTYRILGEVKPINGGIFASSDVVRLEYDNLSKSDFVIKTRGKNSATTGPYSAVSGFTNFNPTQVTQGIDPNTKAVNALGGIVTALAVVDLLKGVDGLYQKVANTSSLFTSIFKTFKDVTGIDLVGSASSGTLVVESSLITKDEGNTITTSTKSINFVGDGVHTDMTGNVVNVYIGSTATQGINITTVTPNYGPTTGGTNINVAGYGFSSVTGMTIGGNTATNFNKVSDTVITATTPAHAGGAVDIVLVTLDGNKTFANKFTYIGAIGPGEVGYLEYVSSLPPDRATGQDPDTGASSDQAPKTGSYFLKFGGPTMYGPMTLGTGAARLYSSDGTLVDTKTAAQMTIHNNVVEIPFIDRDLGTDYYVEYDQGIVKYCNYINRISTDGSGWNFNTPLYAVDPYTSNDNPPTAIPSGSAPSAPVILHYAPTSSVSCPSATVSLTFKVVTTGTTLSAGSGSVYIHDAVTDNIVDTFDVAAATYSNGTFTFGELSNSSVQFNGNYYITADSGIIRAVSAQATDCYLALSQQLTTPNAEITKSDNLTFGVIDVLRLVSVDVDSQPITDSDPNRLKVNPQTNIRLNFNRDVALGTYGSIRIYDSNNNIHQSIDVTTSYSSNKTNELIRVTTSTVVVNPTKDFNLDTDYYLLATPMCIKDVVCGVTWDGITNTSEVTWHTDPGPSTDPVPVTNSSTGLVFAYDRPIEPGAGMIKVYDSNNNLVAEVSSTDPAVSYS